MISTEELLAWVEERNKTVQVEIHKNQLSVILGFTIRRKAASGIKTGVFSKLRGTVRLLQAVRYLHSPSSFRKKLVTWASSARNWMV